MRREGASNARPQQDETGLPAGRGPEHGDEGHHGVGHGGEGDGQVIGDVAERQAGVSLDRREGAVADEAGEALQAQQEIVSPPLLVFFVCNLETE